MHRSDRAFLAPTYAPRACVACGDSFQPYASRMRRCESCRGALVVSRPCAATGCARGVPAAGRKYCSDACATASRRAKARARYAVRGQAVVAAGVRCQDCGAHLRSAKGAASRRCRICWWKATQRKTAAIRKGRPSQSLFTITCQHCGAAAEKRHPRAKFCTPVCRNKAAWKREKTLIAREFLGALA